MVALIQSRFLIRFSFFPLLLLLIFILPESNLLTLFPFGSDGVNSHESANSIQQHLATLLRGRLYYLRRDGNNKSIQSDKWSATQISARGIVAGGAAALIIAYARSFVAAFFSIWFFPFVAIIGVE